MRMCRLMLSVVAFGLTCLQSIAQNPIPTDLGCVIPVTRDCSFNPLTGECGEVCSAWGGHCGWWAAYKEELYNWAKMPGDPGWEGLDTYDNTTWDINKDCGDLYWCICDFDNELNLNCTVRSSLHRVTIWQHQIMFDAHEKCGVVAPPIL